MPQVATIAEAMDHMHIILITTTVASRIVKMIVLQFRDCKQDAATIVAVMMTACHAKKRMAILKQLHTFRIALTLDLSYHHGCMTEWRTMIMMPITRMTYHNQRWEC